MKPVILITGASRGIGAATALLAARAGYTVSAGHVCHRRRSTRPPEGLGQQRGCRGRSQPRGRDVSGTPQAHVRYQCDWQYRVRA